MQSLPGQRTARLFLLRNSEICGSGGNAAACGRRLGLAGTAVCPAASVGSSVQAGNGLPAPGHGHRTAGYRWAYSGIKLQTPSGHGRRKSMLFIRERARKSMLSGRGRKLPCGGNFIHHPGCLPHIKSKITISTASKTNRT